ncbi:MAG: trypsin-like peptidase domain-containing protein, partial [Acetatifactor sp.]|nr:trypsin-like peptidase domain-containing protein [Acetatifactor sp.]
NEQPDTEKIDPVDLSPEEIIPQIQQAGSNIVYTGAQTNVSAIVKEVMPAMVSIINNYTEVTSFWGQTYRENLSASGSGIIVARSDTELLIVTNQHVVSDAEQLLVTLIDDTQVEAKIKGMDADMDLAVIAINLEDLDDKTLDDISIATLGDSDNLELGEQVIAIGNALGYGQSVTVGYISALDREIELDDGSIRSFIQTDAAINPGNSGGALLNAAGEVIGINSNKIGGSSIEGMGYAIPITAASPIIADLMERRTRNKVADSDIGYLGIGPQDVTDQISLLYGMPKGVYIASVQEGSAAENAGMVKGDVITKFDGNKITCYADLQTTLQYYASGDTVKVTVMRPENGEYVERELTLTLGKKPSSR